jgi:hypothetical protein
MSSISAKKQYQQKLKAKLGGLNSSNMAQLRKIQKLEITKEIPQVPLSKFYMYINGKWQYKGVGCRLCQLLLTNETVIDKHRYICKAINKKQED